LQRTGGTRMADWAQRDSVGTGGQGKMRSGSGAA
jgi:hypothetical protein